MADRVSVREHRAKTTWYQLNPASGYTLESVVDLLNQPNAFFRVRKSAVNVVRCDTGAVIATGRIESDETQTVDFAVSEQPHAEGCDCAECL